MEKNKVMMIVIIVLLVVLLGTIVGVSFFAYRVLSADKTEQPNVAQAVVPELKPEEMLTVVLDAPLTTNLSVGADGEAHSFRVNFSIAVDNTDKKESPVFYELLQGKKDIIKADILSVVKSKTYEELARPDGSDVLADEILSKLQGRFQNKLLVDVYVTEWVLP